jgi:hypothetical protein
MSEEKQPSRQVLDELPGKALKFLTALSTNMAVRGLLASRGYTDADHEEGWGVMLTVSGYRRAEAKNPITSVINKAARAALDEIDAWDDPNFRIIRATLRRRYPAQEEFLLEGLNASQGPTCVVMVSTLLDRLQVMESGEGREPTRDDDRKAVELLSARGVTAEVRTHLRALIETVKGTESDADPVPVVRSNDDGDGDAGEARLALHAWYQEWSEIARSVCTRRDHLIALGLGKRKPAKKAA